MQITNFFKSLVFPLQMAKYKTMSALIATMIFLLSVYLIALPNRKNIGELSAEVKYDYNLLALQEIPETDENKAILNEIASFECKVTDKVNLSCANLESGFYENEISYVKEGVTKRIFLSIDLYNLKYNTGNFKGYTKAQYPYVQNEEVYFVTFTKTNLIYQAFQVDLYETKDDPKIIHNDNELVPIFGPFNYQSFMPEFSLDVEEDKSIELGNYIVDQIVTAFVNYNKSMAYQGSFLIIFGYPLLIVLLFWFLFKKRGRLTRFKEYYNVASIASIIPIVLTFTIAWFYPYILNFYIYIFSLYYLFILFKINSAPEVD